LASIVDTGSTAGYIRRMGAFDGAGPEEPTGPSWRGVIGMLIAIIIALAVIWVGLIWLLSGSAPH